MIEAKLACRVAFLTMGLSALLPWQGPAGETDESVPLGIEEKVTLARPVLTKEQQALGKRLKSLYADQPSITAVLLRSDLHLERELELLPEQAAALQQIVAKRVKDRIADSEACALVRTDDQRSVQEFLQRIRELEERREESAIETVREVLLPHQQRELGSLIVKRCDFDLFSLPFAEDVLKLTPQQYEQIAKAQRAANRAFQEIIEKTTAEKLQLREAELEERLKPHAISTMRVTFKVLEVDQLKTLLSLRGSLKEGHTLRQLATTLPPEFRELLEQKLDEAERAGSL